MNKETSQIIITKQHWKYNFIKEFGVHFSKSELQFALAFIEDLLKAQQEEECEEWQKIVNQEKQAQKQEIIDKCIKLFEELETMIEFSREDDKGDFWDMALMPYSKKAKEIKQKLKEI